MTSDHKEEYSHPDPGRFPEIKGVQWYGDVQQLNEWGGGDGFTNINFTDRWDLDRIIAETNANTGFTQENKRKIVNLLKSCKQRGGVFLFDVSGHEKDDSLIVHILHNVFLAFALDSLYQNGHIVKQVLDFTSDRIFDNPIIKSYEGNRIYKYVTGIYLEVVVNYSKPSLVRFIDAAHQPPLIYSPEQGQFVNLGKGYKTTEPLGLFHSDHQGDIPSHDAVTKKTPFFVEQETIYPGDILLLYTDGILEAGTPEYNDKIATMDKVLRKAKKWDAETIYAVLKSEWRQFTRDDDQTLYVIKKDE